jgi:hypothetical protein
MNVILDDAPKNGFCWGYWDEAIVAKFVALLKEYQDLFL